MFNEGKSSYIYQNGVLKAVNPAVEVMIQSAADLASLTGLAPGSWAYTVGNGQRWQLGMSGEWVADGAQPNAEEPAAE